MHPILRIFENAIQVDTKGMLSLWLGERVINEMYSMRLRAEIFLLLRRLYYLQFDFLNINEHKDETSRSEFLSST